MNLNEISREVIVCTKCDLFKFRKNAVPGEGSENAKLMIVGEAPGRNEDALGRPFVGNAGKFLNRYLSMAGIKREETFITNAVKCRPPNNRKPKYAEIIACRPYLVSQIKIIKPKLILSLGVSSATSLGFSFEHLYEIRGKLLETRIDDVQVKVYATFHPSFPMRFPSQRDAFLADLKIVKKLTEE